MTSAITTEDREAAEKYCKKTIGESSVDFEDSFLAGITHCRSQPDSEFSKGLKYAVELLRSEAQKNTPHHAKEWADWLETKLKEER